MIGGVPAIDKAWILKWAAAYMAGNPAHLALETRLLNTDGPAARSRGHYLPQEVHDIAGKWKNGNRNLPSLKQNSAADIVDITRVAFSAPQDLQHRILTLLSGVLVPSATALLVFAFPDVHTVIDVRAIEALDTLSQRGMMPNPPPLVPKGLPPYAPYRAYCVDLAKANGVSLRDLDRALWKWNEQGMQ